MSKRNTWKKLFSYSRDSVGSLILIAVSSLLLALAQILSPYLLGRVLDSMLPGMNMNFKLLMWLLLSYLLTFLFTLVQGTQVANVSNLMSSKLRDRAFSHLTRLPMAFFDQTAQGDVINRLTTDIEAIQLGLQQFFTQIISGTVLLVGSMVAMLRMQWTIGLVVLGLTPFTFLVTSLIAKKSHHYFLEQSEATADLQAHAEEMVQGQKLLRAFGGEALSQEIYDEKNNRLYDVGQKAQFTSSLTNPGTRFVNNVSYVLVGVIASFLAALGKLSIGGISAFLNYALQYAKPVNEISIVMTQVQEALASASRVFSLLEIETEPDETAKPQLQVKEGRFVWDDVSFSYVPGQKLIEDFSIEIKPRQTVAIVGPTGAGKTTLVNLLMRFYELDKGAIYLDDQNLASYTRESVRGAYGMVLQDTWLFAGSIYDNIAYGKEGATKEEVIEAAKKAYAHSFILQLPQGYDTRLKDAGALLSAGQKQLLTIARVMLSDPEILILDEATSNIDTRTEVLVQKSFLQLMEGRTAFIIAHRLSTIRDADLILVMDKGQIIETGQHEELLARKGFYYSLYKD
jgi:ATP-binding cassette subfamily B multidrug efflux pump